MTSAHLDEDRVVQLFGGALSEDDLAQVDEHVDACALCESLVAQIAHSSLLVPAVADTIPEADMVSTVARARLANATTMEKFDLPRAPEDRYALLSLLGRGGMGEVFDAYDHALDRSVALKRVRQDRTDRLAEARFVDEARQTAQLEHPNIIPLHDAGRLPKGAPFYTMKRVTGTSLRDVIHDLSRGDGDAKLRFTPHRLLSALATVSLAVDYAHSRGIIHRDLKPENVMFGDFGEVYVLDWGLAKPFREPEVRVDGEPSAKVATRMTETGGGVVAGTPGYMAPEQGQAGLGPLGPHTDVFALGQLLYEVLTQRPLNVQPRARMLIPELMGSDPRLLSDPETPEIPPELRDVFEHATDPRPRTRMQSAREFADAIERYLQGDRDLERRREISTEHADVAAGWLQRALDEEVPDLEGRHRAMRELGSALALDPENRTALGTMRRLLTEPPSKLPYEVRDRLTASGNETIRMGARLYARLQALWLLGLPFALWMGVQDWASLAGVSAGLIASAGLSLVVSRQKNPWISLQLAIVGTTLMTYLFVSRSFGPLMIVPALASVFAVASQTHPRRLFRRAGYAGGLSMVGLPMVLEWLGVLEDSYSFLDDGMHVNPHMLGLTREPALVFLLFFIFLLVSSAVGFVYRLRTSLNEAEERLQLHAWHLERLMPDEPESTKSTGSTE